MRKHLEKTVLRRKNSKNLNILLFSEITALLFFLQEVPLHSVPVLLANQNKVEMGQALSFNAASQFIETQQSSSYYNESVQKYQETCEEFFEVDHACATSRELLNHRGNVLSRQTLGIQSSSNIFEDIALSDDFLCDYYTQVLVLPLKYLYYFQTSTHTHTDRKNVICPDYISVPGFSSSTESCLCRAGERCSPGLQF